MGCKLFRQQHEKMRSVRNTGLPLYVEALCGGGRDIRSGGEKLARGMRGGGAICELGSWLAS